MRDEYGHRANLRDRPEDYGDEVRLLLECGELPSAVDYLEAQQIRQYSGAEVQAAFAAGGRDRGPHALRSGRRRSGRQRDHQRRDVDALENLIRLVGPAACSGCPACRCPAGSSTACRWGCRSSAPHAAEQSVLDVGQMVQSTAPLGLHRAMGYFGA